ncbi:MAG: hypothetical protein ACP5O6_00170 [Candidatus Baltobacteraceae bacterium]
MPIAQAAVNHLLRATTQIRALPNPGGYGAAMDIPFVRVRGAAEGSSARFADARYAVSGTMGPESQKIVAIPLMSGGSGADFTVLLFAADGTGALRYAGKIDWGGGHIGVAVTYATIVVTEPIYGANDPNCCPSAYLVELYQVRNGKLTRVGSANVPRPG